MYVTESYIGTTVKTFKIGGGSCNLLLLQSLKTSLRGNWVVWLDLCYLPVLPIWEPVSDYIWGVFKEFEKQHQVIETKSSVSVICDFNGTFPVYSLSSCK